MSLEAAVILMLGSAAHRRRMKMKANKSKEIVVYYDGKYPCLCFGHLKVKIGKKVWDFGKSALSSGGAVWFDDDWNEHIEGGGWSINKWPEDFPEDMKKAVVDAVNEQVEKGCCGGCV